MRSVIVHYDNGGISTCYEFSNTKRTGQCVLSDDNFRNIFEAASKEDVFELFLLVKGDISLPEHLIPVFERMKDRIICPLLSEQEQKRRSIPYSKGQLVISENLETFIKGASSISGRSVVLHRRTGQGQTPFSKSISPEASAGGGIM